jgi:hypothetical protein
VVSFREKRLEMQLVANRNLVPTDMTSWLTAVRDKDAIQLGGQDALAFVVE